MKSYGTNIMTEPLSAEGQPMSDDVCQVRLKLMFPIGRSMSSCSKELMPFARSTCDPKQPEFDLFGSTKTMDQLANGQLSPDGIAQYAEKLELHLPGAGIIIIAKRAWLRTINGSMDEILQFGVEATEIEAVSLKNAVNSHNAPVMSAIKDALAQKDKTLLVQENVGIVPELAVVEAEGNWDEFAPGGWNLGLKLAQSMDKIASQKKKPEAASSEYTDIVNNVGGTSMQHKLVADAMGQVQKAEEKLILSPGMQKEFHMFGSLDGKRPSVPNTKSAPVLEPSFRDPDARKLKKGRGSKS